MAKADQSELWPQSAAMLDALLCIQIKSCLFFSNLNLQFKPTDIILSAIAQNRMKLGSDADNLSKVPAHVIFDLRLPIFNWVRSS
jgi:hypothetical protein